MEETELYYLIQDELESGNRIDEFGMREFFQRVVESVVNGDKVSAGVFSRWINAKFGLDEMSMRESDIAFDYGVAFACSGIYEEFRRVAEGIADGY